MTKTHIQFVVEGSNGDEYLTTFEKVGDTLHAYCTCQAGSHGLYCKHRFGLMEGSAEDLMSGNAADLEHLKALMEGTELQAAYARVKDATRQCEQAKKALGRAKKNLARAMYR